MRILLPTDGSKQSEQAAAQCGELISKAETAIVKIVTVNDEGVDFDSSAFSSEAEFIKTLEQEIKKRSQEILGKSEKIIRFKNPDVQIETEILTGSAKEMILKTAKQWKPDLIMIGAQGHGFWSRMFLGSVSESIAHYAPYSVYVARKKIQS